MGNERRQAAEAESADPSKSQGNFWTDVLKAYHRQAQILNRYVLAELLQTEAVLSAVRKEFRRLFDMKPTVEEIRGMLVNTVLKRDTLDGDASTTAKATLKKASSSAARRAAKTVPSHQESTASAST